MNPAAPPLVLVCKVLALVLFLFSSVVGAPIESYRLRLGLAGLAFWVLSTLF